VNVVNNGFRRFHPFILFLYYIVSGILIMLYNHPIFMIIAMCLFIGVNITHDNGKALRKWMIPLFIMGSIFALLNPLLVSRGTHILFYVDNRQITLEALMFGITMALMLITVIILFVSFNLILNGNKFLYLFSKIVPRTAFLMMLAIRFVPLLKRRYDEINAVYRVRGMTIFHGSLKDRANNGMNMLQTLLTWSLEEAIQTADSMQARGYQSRKKSSYTLYKMTKADWMLFSILIVILIVGMLGASFGYGKIVIYPTLGTLQFYAGDWIVLFCMMLAISLPLIVEGIEWLRWKF